jgi:uncharacterized coiled-coil protein SlyX
MERDGLTSQQWPNLAFPPIAMPPAPSGIVIAFLIVILFQLLILKQGRHMSAELDRLTASVTKIKDQDDSIIALVNGLAQQIRDNANNPAALNALADSLDAEAQKVADAVSQNTTPPPPTPAP